MALVFAGSKSRSAGVFSAWKKHLNLLNLKPVKKITFKFDPFGNNPTAVRDFMFLLSSQQAIQTNPLCRQRYEVACDRSEPTVEILLDNGGTVLFKCNNLTTLEMFQLFNQHVTVLAPKEEPVQEAPLATKGSKARSTKKR